ncbi:MAG: hypothetical protein COZ46_00410 [Verrucomicrobia bacterium CG_4_10_14_3_um_filter_43_23]|nr:MAG: hypothetical protein AUJ82_04530 [Verrucomicrobia bacterium CG1_02_43_26]PIP59039.1 MAG: hypothetical protein COX01_05680 [Verrucomicrobia bacterium CG22_combo_CG10-13_8_21_14_all_43_17]PIX59136.1 MAG: hypothetical protein COZ46_00410 [Verrucomicrobia bacterium CG_4_10_14_3_um_filter_43_23]PIY61342.1 MAG: hypothetical protein COY94_05700 [Verrucomicrobia bacterium CG_4_10_14_0_8_um_filter_43_34]PJA44123.1 MAG: hypothetical protein CO175_04415 [Verrucomicrobia bacterium CG_4_9_14_3_um_fi
MRRLGISLLLLGLVILAGCDKTSSTLGGAGIGTAAGAGLGYMIGGGATGAIIGGVAGGLGGAAIGHQVGDDEKKK